MDHTLTFLQINLLFILMFLTAHFLRKLSIPPIVSFLLIGFLAKFWLHPESTQPLELFKEAGVILLFFFIGLEYSFERLKNMISIWKPSFIDFSLNFLPIFFISMLFGFDVVSSLVIAGVFYPSSTSIVAKLLMDFKRLASPEAELLIGILIFEDLFSILLLSLLIPMIEFGSFEPRALPISLIKITVILLIFYFIHRILIPRVQKWLDRISEDENFVFFLLGLIMVVGISFKEIGISEALGAFLLGVLVPETRVMENIEHHLSSLKELSIGVFFFFFSYESELSFPSNMSFILVLIILGITLKILSTYLAAYVYGMKKKARFRTSLSFVPRGEFSVVIASLEPSLKLLSIPFIFSTAVVGSVLFVLAPKVADIFYPPKKKLRKGKEVPLQAQVSSPQDRQTQKP